MAHWAERRQLVGARIRELRLQKGITQETVALGTGLSRNMVMGIEGGRRSVAYERLWDIAEILNVPITSILLPPESTLEGKTQDPSSTSGAT